MSCCGQKRNEYKQDTKQNPVSSVNKSLPPKIWKDTQFEYTGKSALTVTGPITGRHYRFAQMGDIQLIDYRDVSAIKAVPVLKVL